MVKKRINVLVQTQQDQKQYVVFNIRYEKPSVRTLVLVASTEVNDGERTKRPSYVFPTFA